jgi:hypothetical protein
MTDTEALAAFMRGETLDDPTSRRLWTLGWVLLTDASEHNPDARREVMADRPTDTGKRVWDAMLSDPELIEGVQISPEQRKEVIRLRAKMLNEATDVCSVPNCVQPGVVAVGEKQRCERHAASLL